MDIEMVRHLSDLGKLTFTDEELEKVAKDMTGIIKGGEDRVSDVTAATTADGKKIIKMYGYLKCGIIYSVLFTTVR